MRVLQFRDGSSSPTRCDPGLLGNGPVLAVTDSGPPRRDQLALLNTVLADEDTKRERPERRQRGLEDTRLLGDPLAPGRSAHSESTRGAESRAGASAADGMAGGVVDGVAGGVVDIRLRTGDAIGKYQIIRELGRGGMGAVYLARDTRLGRRVAIKVLNTGSQALGERLIAEARATARCNHDNIVIVHEAEEHDGLHYMVLEYLEGQTLRHLLERASVSHGERPSLPPERAVELIVPVVRALERAHEMGIVHRDLKPENVMLTRAGSIKVLDFGIAKMRAAPALPVATATETAGEARADTAPADDSGLVHSSSTLTGALVGTVPYMAPEQLRCEDIDHRVDIWAVGIMCYEMVTGQHPLGTVTAEALLRVSDPALPMPLLSDIRPDLGTLGEIVDRCLLKDPDARTGSARQLLDELEPILPGRRDLVLSADQNPFAGLAAYQEADAARFFGRSDDIANVVTRVRSQPLVAVIGPSGVGKSSLIRAGVIPALKQSGEGWETAIIRPGRRPLEALSGLFEQFIWRSTARPNSLQRTENLRAPSVADAIPQRAELQLEPGQLGTEMRAWAQAKMRRVLVFVDQFEEIFTLTADPLERQAFIACLNAIADDASSRLRVILSIRADFVEHLARERELLSAATGGMVFLSPIARAGLREALHKPIAAAGYRFESEDITEDMLDALEATRGALPLLQFTASRLWDVRDRERRLLTASGYHALGGISGALAKHADTVLDSMSARSAQLTRAIFQRLVTPERTRALASVAELCELAGAGETTTSDESKRGAADSVASVEQVLDELANARLLLVDTGADEQGTIEIVHESLISSWPRLREWLDENQDDAEFLAKLRAAAREWESSERAEGLLWSGDIADEARVWRARYQGQLASGEQNYLDAVFAVADRALLRRRMLTYGGMLAILLLVVIGAIALTKSQQVDTIQKQQKQLHQLLQKAENATRRVEIEKSEAEIARDLARQMSLKAQGAEERVKVLEVQILELEKQLGIRRPEPEK